MTLPPEVEPETLRELLRAEKARPGPPAEAAERLSARLAQSLGLPPGLGDGVPAAPGPSFGPSPARPGFVRRTLAGASRRGLATFLVGAAVGAASYGTVEHLRSQPAAPVREVLVLAEPAPAPPSTLAPAAADGPPAATEPVRPAAVTAGRGREAEPGMPDARDRRLRAERKLVEMARSALARGHVDGALAALRSHMRSYPNGQLAEERDSLLVQALAAKREFAQARERAVRFHKQHPGSLFGPVVDEAVRSIP